MLEKCQYCGSQSELSEVKCGVCGCGRGWTACVDCRRKASIAEADHRRLEHRSPAATNQQTPHHVGTTHVAQQPKGVPVSEPTMSKPPGTTNDALESRFRKIIEDGLPEIIASGIERLLHELLVACRQVSLSVGDHSVSARVRSVNGARKPKRPVAPEKPAKRRKPDMTCRAPECNEKSRGPRFSYYCLEHDHLRKRKRKSRRG
jgi:hypothetical protein